MGWEKFGQAAWGTAAKTSVVEWEGAKDDQDECCICMTALNSQEVYTLECKHAFHKEVQFHVSFYFYFCFSVCIYVI